MRTYNGAMVQHSVNNIDMDGTSLAITIDYTPANFSGGGQPVVEVRNVGSNKMDIAFGGDAVTVTANHGFWLPAGGRTKLAIPQGATTMAVIGTTPDTLLYTFGVVI